MSTEETDQTKTGGRKWMKTIAGLVGAVLVMIGAWFAGDRASRQNVDMMADRSEEKATTEALRPLPTPTTAVRPMPEPEAAAPEPRGQGAPPPMAAPVASAPGVRMAADRAPASLPEPSAKPSDEDTAAQIAAMRAQFAEARQRLEMDSDKAAARRPQFMPNSEEPRTRSAEERVPERMAESAPPSYAGGGGGGGGGRGPGLVPKDGRPRTYAPEAAPAPNPPQALLMPVPPVTSVPMPPLAAPRAPATSDGVRAPSFSEAPAPRAVPTKPRGPEAVGELSVPSKPRTASAPPAAEPAPAPPTRSVQETRMVKLYFATDRKWTGADTSPKWFGADWNHNVLTYGTCVVSIPVKHEAGKIEGRAFWEMRDEDLQRDVIVHLPVRLAKNPYFVQLKAAVEAARDKEVVVFIHGFNNTFEEAGKREGVLAFDMNFNGVPVLYSWTAMGGKVGVFGYVRDADRCEKTKRPLADFLADMTAAARAGGAKRVNVVAHSMGNRALIGALQTLVEKGPKGRLIDEVVMAAPDVMADGFEDTEWRYLRRNDGQPEPIGRFTLYASSTDRALLASKLLHWGARVGEAGPALLILQGLETIDATGVDFSTFGLDHSYFGGVRVTRDLRPLCARGATPKERNLVPKPHLPLAYWVLPLP